MAASEGFHAFQESYFTVAEQQDAACLQVLVKACQREARLLDVGTGDVALEPVGAGEKLDRLADRFGPRVEQAAYGDGRSNGHRLAQVLAGAWPRLVDY